MKASVIICTYNRAESLRTALQCLEWQTFDDFEVIVVNGPSTDNTDEVLKEYKDKIKILHNSQKNYIISRNMGANEAAGDVLCYIDDDSEPDAPWLSNVMHEFENTRVGAVTGPVSGRFASDPTTKTWLCDNKGHVRVVPVLFPHCSSSESTTFTYTHGCNMSIRRSVLEEVGCFLEDFVFYYDEPELCRRLINAGYLIVNVESCGLIHNTFSGNDDKKMRDKSKGLLRPYHALKNLIYLCYAWRKKDTSDDVLRQIAENEASALLEHGRRRFRDGILTYEEWCHYKEGISLGLAWGLEHGAALDIESPPQLQKNSDFFLHFPSRRKENALVVCLFLWSLGTEASGVIQDFSNLAMYLARRGHEVHVMAPAHEEAYVSFESHVHWHYLQQKNYFKGDQAGSAAHIVNSAALLFDAVNELCQTRVVDICTGFIFNSSPLFTGMDINLNSILKLCTTHKTWCRSHPHWRLSESKMIGALEALTVKTHDNIHIISDFILRGVSSDYSDCVQPGINIFNIPIGTPRMENVNISRHDDVVQILFVSRLEGRKCPDILLAAFAKIAKKIKNIELIIAGDDSLVGPSGRTYRQQFEAQYFGTEICSRVHFTGLLSEEEKWEHYHSCDIFCMPSLSESFGITFIEAMACGKPVVGCRAGGMPEVITEGETGLLAEPGDVSSLASCLELLVCDKKLRERMGQAAHLKYEQNFTCEIYAQRIEEEFYRIAGKSGAQQEGRS